MDQDRKRVGGLRVALIGAICASLMTVAGVGAFAGLNATASATQTASDGTLSLTSTNNGVGFTTAITNLAPGDIVNRYVKLTNGGTLSAKSFSLKITSTGTATLITDGTGAATNKAITVAVNSCAGTWTPATGACSGVTTNEIAATPLSTFASAQPFLNTTSMASLADLNLQIQVKLPDQSETTVDGVAPAVTVQNGSVTLGYLFYEAQRTVATTNS